MHDDWSMHDDGFVGEISEDTRLGILTYTDSQYNYVWAPHLKTLELRYPLNPQLAFQPGDTVRFLQQKDGRGPQIVHDLVKEKDIKLDVVREVNKDGIAWKAKANMVFASPTNARFRKMKQIHETLQGLAFTDTFMEVLCFLELDVTPGVVYQGYITRLPEPFITLGKKLGSLFCVKHRKDTPFNTVVTNAADIKELMEKCPFADEFTEDGNDDIGLPKNPAPPSNWTLLTDNDVSRNDVDRVSNEDSAINYADRLVDLEEGTASLGLIVRTADEYAVIWSPTHDLVRIQLASDDEQRKQEQYQPKIATWVSYRCFEEQSQLHGGIRCNYTAYSITTASPREDRLVNTCVTDYGTEVILQCFLTEPRQHNSQLFHALDTFAGQIICPCDRFLMGLLQKEETVEVMCIFTDEYKGRWIAFAVKKQQKDGYVKLDKLPAVIDAKVQPFLSRVGVGRKVQQIDEQMHLMNVGARFQPPLDWTGPKECGNTVVSVLGVAIGNEQQETECVIATAYGIARQPKRLELGTWVEATIQVENDDQARRTPHYESFMHERTYRVLYSEKISPPLSTRVVNKNGVEKLLLCGDVKCILNGLRNDYLGRVEDTKNHVNAQAGESYLVEFGITRQSENRRNCLWSILKCHGKSVKNVHKVPLQLSIYPIEEGKTCDDAHRILIDRVFDAKKHAWDSSAGQLNAYEQVGQQSQDIHPRDAQREDLNRRIDLVHPATAHSSRSSSSSMNATTTTKSAHENFRTKQQQQQWVELPTDSTNSTAPSAEAYSQHKQQSRQNEPLQHCCSSTNNGGGVGSSFFDVNLDAYTVNRNAVDATTSAEPVSSYSLPPLKKTIPATNSTKFAAAGEDDDEAVLAELSRYEPSAEKKISKAGIVVRKRTEYLLMYHPTFGLSILLPKYADVSSAEEFDEKFTLGEFYVCSFVRVAEREKRGLTYEWMCKGDFRLISPKLQTRLVMDNYVHVLVSCEFTKENMMKLHSEHYIIKTDLGNVRMGKDFLELNGLFGKTVNVWVSFVKEIEGCHWEIVADAWNSFLDGDESDAWADAREQVDVVVVQPKQQKPKEPLRNKLYNHTGYFDFLFGSEVRDGMGGERYQSERYGMPNDSDAEVESASDLSGPVENWDDSSTTTGSDCAESFTSICPFDAEHDFESRMRIIGGATPPRQEQGRETSFPNHHHQHRQNGDRTELVHFE